MHSSHPQFTPPSPAVEARINGMIAKLSLEDKIDLLAGSSDKKRDGGDTVAKPHAGIPSFKMADASVGIHWWTDASTTYPATIALAASFNRELAGEFGKAVGRDARARGIHILLGPGVNMYRSALCGRNFEYLGEDPVLAAQLVTEYIRGCQSQAVSATVKHFALNNQEFERNHTSSDADERTLREVYLPAFEAAIRDGGSGALMTSYNLVNGVHASEHDHLVREVLKGEWGFDGVAMSDWVSVYSTVNAANAGLDLEMPVAQWFTREKLLPAVKNGLVGEAVIDDKIRRLLRLAACFGWLDHPQKDESIPLHDESTAAVALAVAREGVVLLKNAGGILPLDRKKLKRLAVIGPMAHPAVIGGGGSAYNKPWRSVSILDGIKAHAQGVEVCFTEGAKAMREFASFAETAYTTADGVPGMTATYFNTLDFSGPVVRSVVERVHHEDWQGPEKPIAEGVDKNCFSIRWRGFFTAPETGVHVIHLRAWDGGIRLTVGGEVLIDRLGDKILGTSSFQRSLTAGQKVEVVVEFVRNNAWNMIGFGVEPLSRLKAEQDAAVALAKSCDAVVYCGGFNHRTEAEGVDREFVMQPAESDELLAAVAAANPNTVAVLTGGGNLDMNRWIDAVAGVLHAWYPGQEGGRAVAEILFGEVNPSGKLPATFEKRLEDRSSFDCYHDADGDKRVTYADGIFGGYRHFDRSGIAPRFPFGFGLSYTTFAYENLTLAATEIKAKGRVKVACEIVNTGTREGRETVQLYIRDEAAAHIRPVKELKHFAKVALKPGKRKRVTFTITAKDLRYFDPDQRKWVVEPGSFQVLVGASSADIRLEGRFTVTG